MVRPSRKGVRPNSPLHTTIVSSPTVVGSRVVDVRAAYPAVQFFPEDDFFPPSFVVTDSLRGFLTGVDDDATVTAIIGGDDCGI